MWIGQPDAIVIKGYSKRCPGLQTVSNFATKRINISGVELTKCSYKIIGKQVCQIGLITSDKLIESIAFIAGKRNATRSTCWVKIIQKKNIIV